LSRTTNEVTREVDAPTPKLISIVVPAFNEQEVVEDFHQRVTSVVSGLKLNYEVIYVNDGSTDHTSDILSALHDQDIHVTVIELSRNYGKEIALTAGLDHSQGDVTIVIDADLQDPPELIPELIMEWKNGFDVVYAKRRKRKGETLLKKTTAFLFYRLIRKSTQVEIPEDTGDYRLLSRRAVDAVCKMREQHRFMKGIFSWIGFPQKSVLYDRDSRTAGSTKWNYWNLWNFALEGITSFTTIPLRVSTYIGFVTAFGALMFGLYIIVKTLLFGDPVPGYPTLAVIILFLGGMQLIAIGVLGEYLGRIFNETKGRPLYFLNSYFPSEKTRVFTETYGSQSIMQDHNISSGTKRPLDE